MTGQYDGQCQWLVTLKLQVLSGQLLRTQCNVHVLPTFQQLKITQILERFTDNGPHAYALALSIGERDTESHIRVGLVLHVQCEGQVTSGGISDQGLRNRHIKVIILDWHGQSMIGRRRSSHGNSSGASSGGGGRGGYSHETVVG